MSAVDSLAIVLSISGAGLAVEPPAPPAILLLRCGAPALLPRDILRADGVLIVSECNDVVVRKPPERKY